ncbi:hypothetical protein [Cereibacter sphaeroides]|uniref:hypothetical protein n=1 Tax=Cereibacter sphaeroides TaxID=1063 RepID=UPI001FD00109|nr:hypothetical protein [Cereibacter sphaeroides]
MSLLGCRRGGGKPIEGGRKTVGRHHAGHHFSIPKHECRGAGNRERLGEASVAVNDGRYVVLPPPRHEGRISAGSPFAQLQKAGMPTAIMADIQRQRNAREAVLHAIRGEVRAAFSRIEDLRTPEKNQSFTGEVARAWLGLHSSVRERTRIVF